MPLSYPLWTGWLPMGSSPWGFLPFPVLCGRSLADALASASPALSFRFTRSVLPLPPFVPLLRRRHSFSSLLLAPSLPAPFSWAPPTGPFALPPGLLICPAPLCPLRRTRLAALRLCRLCLTRSPALPPSARARLRPVFPLFPPFAASSGCPLLPPLISLCSSACFPSPLCPPFAALFLLSSLFSPLRVVSRPLPGSSPDLCLPLFASPFSLLQLCCVSLASCCPGVLRTSSGAFLPFVTSLRALFPCPLVLTFYPFIPRTTSLSRYRRTARFPPALRFSYCLPVSFSLFFHFPWRSYWLSAPASAALSSARTLAFSHPLLCRPLHFHSLTTPSLPTFFLHSLLLLTLSSRVLFFFTFPSSTFFPFPSSSLTAISLFCPSFSFFAPSRPLPSLRPLHPSLLLLSLYHPAVLKSPFFSLAPSSPPPRLGRGALGLSSFSGAECGPRPPTQLRC